MQSYGYVWKVQFWIHSFIVMFVLHNKNAMELFKEDW